MACEAILAACADAGVAVTEIDGVSRYGVEQVAEPTLCATLGIPDLTFMAETPSGGGGLAATVGLAAMAVESGRASTVLCFRSRARSKGASYGVGALQGGRPWAKAGHVVSGAQQFHHPFGLAAPAQEMALIARRYLDGYGWPDEALGHQAVAQRFHASRNPAAILREIVSLDDWRDGRMVADPLRLYDCSLECDGAVALLVTSSARARDLRQRPVRVVAAEQGWHPIHTQLPDYFALTDAFDRDAGRGQRALGRRLFARADATPAAVDVAMVFDHFTIAVPLTLEAFGFCGPGEAGGWLLEERTRWPDGDLPVNTHGGSNGEAFIHGYNHLPEAVRQARGTAVNQVPGCELVFVNGSPTDPSGAVLLAPGD